MFACATSGADASATTYNIKETAKANNLNPRAYLQYIFEQMPLINKRSDKQLDSLLPWNPKVQAACGIPNHQIQKLDEIQ